MAFSASEGKLFFKDWLIHVAKPLNFYRFLDVGCGAGCYGDIIKEVFNSGATIHAVEPFVEYISRHSLGKKYNRIIIEDIRDVYLEMENYDLIIMGDVLEHLSKEDAVLVVNGLIPKCKFLWGALPIKIGRSWSTGYLQGPQDYEENLLNRHLYDWTGDEIYREFNPMFLVPFIQTGVFLIEGKIGI